MERPVNKNNTEKGKELMFSLIWTKVLLLKFETVFFSSILSRINSCFTLSEHLERSITMWSGNSMESSVGRQGTERCRPTFLWSNGCRWESWYVRNHLKYVIHLISLILFRSSQPQICDYSWRNQHCKWSCSFWSPHFWHSVARRSKLKFEKIGNFGNGRDVKDCGGLGEQIRREIDKIREKSGKIQKKSVENNGNGKGLR